MNEGQVIVIGLTGQTGAGKSTVSGIFVRNGFALIDADKIARDVEDVGTPCLEELFEYFGDEIRNEDNSLNRKALAKIAFTDKKKLEVLNSIVHPFITAEIFAQMNQYSAEGYGLILLDAPTLFESKASDFCDLIISVLAEPEIRCERIIQRDGLTKESACERMNAQLPEEFFIQHSDYVVRNDGNLDSLFAQSEEIVDKIKIYYHKMFSTD